MPLTDAKVRALKPRDKPYRLGDAGGYTLKWQRTDRVTGA